MNDNRQGTQILSMRAMLQVITTLPTLRSSKCHYSEIHFFHLTIFYKGTKLSNIDQATDHNPEYEPSTIYDSMDNENKEDTKAQDNTYDNMYEDN